MSSTNRGGDRHASDYYITPQDQIREFLNKLLVLEDIRNPILDPCAGGDPIHEMSYPAVLNEMLCKPDVHTLDIREDSRAFEIVDYLQWTPEQKFSTIITNPPFCLAREFICKAREEVVVGGLVIALLRLNFFGSQKRRNFWHDWMPKYCFVHPKRMSFTDDGGTDSVEYMHAVWKIGQKPQRTPLCVL